MIKLLYKEIKLTVNITAYIFPILAAMLLIPSYPKLIGMLYFIITVQITFQLALTNKDAKFTAMLPIPRNDVVKSKCICLVYIQFLQILAAIPFALISCLIVDKNGNLVGMDANFAFFGEVLIMYAIFNLVFLTTFFRTGYKLGLPFLCSIVVFFVAALAMELCIGFVPILKNTLDSLSEDTIVFRLIFLAVGVIVYILGIVFTYKISCKNYSKVTVE